MAQDASLLESVCRGPARRPLPGAGQIPVARFSADAQQALRAADTDLSTGNVVVVHPEGSVPRDPDWWPMEARTGVARLAPTTDAVVLPAAQCGAQRVRDQLAELRGDTAPPVIPPRPRRDQNGNVSGSAA